MDPSGCVINVDAYPCKPEPSALQLAIREREILEHFKALCCWALFWIASSTVWFSYIERWGLVDSLYFSTATISTIGFGDLAPETPLGRASAVALSLVGIAVFSATVDAMRESGGAISQLFTQDRQPLLVLLPPLTLLGLTWLMKIAEGWSWGDSLYFVAIAACSTGYGDIAPVTDGGKLVVVIVALYSVTFFVLFVTYFKLIFIEHLGKIAHMLRPKPKHRPHEYQ